MGEINEAVVSMRAFFDEIDEDVMDQVRSGEEWTVSALKDAEEKAVGGPESEKITEMRAELENLLAETRSLD
ncbi:MAG: hypothetical protein AAF322_17945, partial [Pseudomonadota bacterium]